MKNLIALMALALSVMACQEGPKPEISGTYYGITPCADCPGIYYQLDLNEDMTYHEKRFYLNSPGDSIVVQGPYEIQSDSIVVLLGKEDEEGFDRLRIGDGKLFILDQNGNMVEGELAEYYILKTTKPEMQRKNAPIFKATGTEPFWSLKIVPNEKMLFEPMDGKRIVLSVGEPKMIEDGESFSASKNGEMLKVDITNKTCQNAMSGEYFSHTVSVTFKTKDMQEAKTWEGCGEYLNSANLEEIADKINGDWILKKINGEPLPENPNYKTPTMKIVLMEGFISGNAGCNQYSGHIKYLEGNKLAVHRVVSTLMACPGLEVEKKFLGIFSGKPIEFQRRENHLILENEDTELVFEKA